MVIYSASTFFGFTVHKPELEFQAIAFAFLAFAYNEEQ